MKRILIFFILASYLFIRSASAGSPPDEGMWIPILLDENKAELKKAGCKLTPKQIFDANNSSLKDAVVWFNGGCTGEIVSDNGLIFTNHHCGYGAIVSLSTPQDNLLDNGFWAKNYAEEKPAKGLFIQFVIRIEDVSQKVISELGNVSEADRNAKLGDIYKSLIDKVVADEKTKGNNYEAIIRETYKGNAYYMFVMERFNDIRLVGTPPWSIGKFGGETDNWMWPRHTGDFSVFRVYADGNNHSASYSPNNKPYKPKHFLPISIKGFNPGDFSMILGFPGRTNRFEFSQGIDVAINSVNPTLVDLRDIRLKAWKEQMNKSDSLNLLLASQYASIANYWKYYIGQTEQLKHLHVYEEKKKEETEFNTWAAGKPEYQNLMTEVENTYAPYRTVAVQRTFINEGLLTTNLASLASLGYSLDTLLAKNDTTGVKKLTRLYSDRVDGAFKSFIRESDQKIFAEVLNYYYTHCRKEDLSPFIHTIFERYPASSEEASFKKYAEDVYNKSLFASKTRFADLISNPSSDKLRGDLGVEFVREILQNYIKRFKPAADAFTANIGGLGREYVKGVMQMHPEKKFYPDANSSMRFTYGSIQDYDPKDGVHYKYYTTLDGVMEKYEPGNEEFDLPKKLIDLYYAKDYGRYAMKNGQLPVGFITNNDITGGNSGSPVMNAKGELIGLAFDGNWEAMSGDIAFDKKYKRTICVDVRYVLFCIDKLGGATNIINELKITQ
jgi:hypothetical protein